MNYKFTWYILLMSNKYISSIKQSIGGNLLKKCLQLLKTVYINITIYLLNTVKFIKKFLCSISSSYIYKLIIFSTIMRIILFIFDNFSNSFICYNLENSYICYNLENPFVEDLFIYEPFIHDIIDNPILLMYIIRFILLLLILKGIYYSENILGQIIKIILIFTFIFLYWFIMLNYVFPITIPYIIIWLDSLDLDNMYNKIVKNFENFLRSILNIISTEVFAESEKETAIRLKKLLYYGTKKCSDSSALNFNDIKACYDKQYHHFIKNLSPILYKHHQLNHAVIDLKLLCDTKSLPDYKNLNKHLFLIDGKKFVKICNKPEISNNGIINENCQPINNAKVIPLDNYRNIVKYQGKDIISPGLLPLKEMLTKFCTTGTFTVNTDTERVVASLFSRDIYGNTTGHYSVKDFNWYYLQKRVILMTEALNFYDNYTSGKPYTTFSHEAFKYWANEFMHTESCLNMRKGIDYTNGHIVCNKLLLELGITHRQIAVKFNLWSLNKLIEIQCDFRTMDDRFATVPLSDIWHIKMNSDHMYDFHKCTGCLKRDHIYWASEDNQALSLEKKNLIYGRHLVVDLANEAVEQAAKENPILYNVILNLAKNKYNIHSTEKFKYEVGCYNRKVAGIYFQNSWNLFIDYYNGTELWPNEFHERGRVHNPLHLLAFPKDESIRAYTKYDAIKIGLSPKMDTPQPEYTHVLHKHYTREYPGHLSLKHIWGTKESVSWVTKYK